MFWRRGGRLREKFFQLANGGDFVETDIAEVRLIPAFQSAHQFDSIERRHVQVGIERGIARIGGDGASGDLGDQRGQGAIAVFWGDCFVESCVDELANAREQRLQSRRAREVRIGPQKQAANLLIFRQGAIGVFEYGRLVRVRRVFEQQHRARLRVAVAFDADHHAIAHSRLATHRFFEIFGMDVHARGRNDHIFAAAFEIQAALRVGFAHVSGAKPSIGFHDGLRLIVLTVRGGDIFAAHQDFAVLVHTNFHAGENFADGAFRGTERMIEADERSGLGHAVTLNHGISQAVPECFHLFGEGGASGNERPEFPAQKRMDFAESPPAREEMLILGAREIFVEVPGAVVAFHLAQDFALQRFDKARNRY